MRLQVPLAATSVNICDPTVSSMNAPLTVQRLHGQLAQRPKDEERVLDKQVVRRELPVWVSVRSIPVFLVVVRLVCYRI